jgi:hypothetical protein
MYYLLKDLPGCPAGTEFHLTYDKLYANRNGEKQYAFNICMIEKSPDWFSTEPPNPSKVRYFLVFYRGNKVYGSEGITWLGGGYINLLKVNRLLQEQYGDASLMVENIIELSESDYKRSTAKL